MFEVSHLWAGSLSWTEFIMFWDKKWEEINMDQIHEPSPKEKKQAHNWESLASKPTLFVKFQSSERPYLKKKEVVDGT